VHVTSITYAQVNNSTDLSGWSPGASDAPGPTGDAWSVRNGVLVGKAGTLLTSDSFTSFTLGFEWRWVPGTTATNAKTAMSGVLLRVNGPSGSSARCLRVQLQVGAAGAIYGLSGMKAAPFPPPRVPRLGMSEDTDTSAVSADANAEKPVGQWNRGEIKLHGTKLTVSVNGQKVNEATVSELVDGPVGLQASGAEIEFRAVEITPLP
jgi:hypothetical protein